ncbi:phosphoribosylamine--glycine ligase [Paracraurococcus ruber]|uniref:phosphoribosylamine--glycine ligase n=1 Tax=Paracraurococcus ruber TaxID=77675 RepID=UPI001057851A|nr:phosphoribosylamine--glycine ligase [Paracraurococcus ruber]TDG28447.1 phosphoribosylamine--glycine ligase [Paracraurococcus ruber]
MPIAALLLLGGCGMFGGGGPPPGEDTPEHRACWAESRNAPEVRTLARETNTNNTFNQTRLEGEIRQAQLRAYRNCLRDRGVGQPGGVESLRPR